MEERDSTTRQRLAICAHSHSVTKTGLSKTVLQETARYHFTTSWAAHFRHHLPSLRAPVFCPQMGNIVGMSGAGHGPLLGNDLQANLPEAKRTSGRNTPRMLRTADGAHAGFECGFPQSWPPRLQILKVPLAQPVPQPSPKLFDWVQIWGPTRMTERTWRRGTRRHDNVSLYVHTAILYQSRVYPKPSHRKLPANMLQVGFIQNRLTGNCPLTFYYFVGIAATKVLTHFVSMLKTTSE